MFRRVLTRALAFNRATSCGERFFPLSQQRHFHGLEDELRVCVVIWLHALQNSRVFCAMTRTSYATARFRLGFFEVDDTCSAMLVAIACESRGGTALQT
jgi:hypothetical protein